MEQVALPNGDNVYCLNRNEALLLYADLFEERSYFQFGVGVRPGDTVVDVGANIGLFSLLASREAEHVEVIALEPLPPICDVLRANFELHGIAGRVLRHGIGLRAEKVPFTYYPDNSALSGKFADPTEERELIARLLRSRFPKMPAVGLEVLAARGLSQETFECSVRPLSEVLLELGGRRVGLLKVDVEKAELEVLRSIGEGDWGRIDQVVVEVHDLNQRLEKICTLLRDKGFDVHESQGKAFGETNLWDVFATRRGKSH